MIIIMILNFNFLSNAFIKNAMVTMDFRTDRVRVFVDDEGKVVREPHLG